jgi:hypothetical protein
MLNFLQAFFDNLEIFVFRLIYGKDIPYRDRGCPVEFYHLNGLLDYWRIVCPNQNAYNFWLVIFGVFLSWLVI